LPPAAADDVEAWQREHLHGVSGSACVSRSAGVSGGRIVARSNLHITLAFLGPRPAGELPAIAGALAEAAADGEPVRLRPVAYRETRSVGMIRCEDVTGAGAAFASDLQERLERLGAYRKEARPWLAHVTVLRFKDRPLLAAPVENVRSFTAVRAALYCSVLRPSGAQYDVLETVALGGR
jgi:2'-5' RNA ligase